MSVVGIDLGTTNTVVACVRSGKVHVLADEHGVRLLPSVVSFHPNGQVLVGGAAKARRVIDPSNTVYSHKRLIGRSWGSPEIALAKSRFPFELKEGPGQGPLIRARGQDYTLPEVSAFVLKRTRQIAEIALGSPIERAVITVPAHFNELQRASTKVAGRVSGLEILRILNEPTAAALAYGLGRTGSERVAVYDFGGGTFDCTLLDLNGNVFEVLATAGDSFLGGDDIDNMIAERMAETYLQAHRSDPRTDPQMLERLKTVAEEMKMVLSTAETHTVVLKGFGHGTGGSSINYTFTMTRHDLDHMITPLVERSFKVTQDALALARLSPTSFDKVILVGGSTRIPLIRKRVEAFFGAPPLDRVNPDEVVAIGAAIQAAALTEGARRRSIPAPPGAFALKPRTAPALPPDETQTGVGRGTAGFGAIDEPPSILSTPSASSPSFPSTITRGVSASQMPSPLGEPEPFGRESRASRESSPGDELGFGHVADLSLASSSVATALVPEISQARQDYLDELDDETEANRTAVGRNALSLGPVAPPRTNARAPATLIGHDEGADLPAVAQANDLPAFAGNRAGPTGSKRPEARTPGQLGMSPVGGASMAGKPPPKMAPSPFGPMEKLVAEAPQTLTAAMPARSPPAAEPALKQPSTAPMHEPLGRRGPSAPPPFAAMAPVQPAPFPGPPAPPYPSMPPPQHPPMHTQPFGSSPPPQPHHQVQAFSSHPPPQNAGYGSAPPHASQPPIFGAYQSAPPPAMQPMGAPGGYGPGAQVAPGPPRVPQNVGYASPVLVDVTPRGLVVETAGGYTDTVIPRNAKIPCERTRRFATGRDMQTSVRIRVGQGESQHFPQNTFLGEVELSGLRPAPRGEVVVAVTFEVDADGTLRVRARDVQTGHEARATLQLIGIADESSVVMMINRFAQQPVVGGEPPRGPTH